VFVLDPTPTFAHQVKVRVPSDGGHLDQSFKATFRVLPIEKSATFDLTDGPSSTAFLREIVTHLDDIVDATNAPVSYSDTLRDQLLELPYVRSALVAAYFAAIGGAKLGN
jgi:hypothetical protein